MTISLSCYYLDQPLTEEELQFIGPILLGPWAKFKTGADTLVQKRVPLVLPVPDADGRYLGTREQRAEHVRRNLRKAGIRSDNSRQIVWITPRDNEWDAIFQFAIREETGLAPYLAQRWFVKEGVMVRGAVRVIDTQMLVQGL